MQTETMHAETFGTQPDNLKAATLAALREFIRKRPRLDAEAYRGAFQTYRAEVRRISRDLKEAETLLRRVELCPSITGRDMVEATRGRGLRIIETPQGVRVEYVPGQSYPNEYRAAVARFAASILWDFVRERAMPAPVYMVEWKNERGEWIETGETFANSILAELHAAEVRQVRQREAGAFQTPPQGYGDTLLVERYRAAGLSRAISGGEWLRRYFRRELGRGIASRWFE